MVEVNLFLGLNKHHENDDTQRNESIAPHILNLSARWKWVVSFTPGERATGIPEPVWTRW